MTGPETRSAPQETGDVHRNAYAFLDAVLKRYSAAKTYHIELLEETQMNSEMRRDWERRSVTAVVLPDRRYRFESQSAMGRGAPRVPHRPLSLDLSQGFPLSASV
jgi:hypothetical protein